MNRVAMAAGLVFFVSFPGSAFATSGPDPSGLWNRGDGNAKVRIAPCGSNICATNVWIKDTSGGEAVGDKLVMTLKPKSADTLTGMAVDPKRSLSYAIQLKVAGQRLVTRGCLVGGLVCKSVYWSRAR